MPSQWLLDRSVFANGSYYGFKTNVEQLHGTWLSVSRDVKICFTNSDYVLVDSEIGKSIFMFAECFCISHAVTLFSREALAAALR